MNRDPMARPVRIAIAVAIVAISTSVSLRPQIGRGPAPSEIFYDGFESGDTSAWSDGVGLPPVPPTAFRFSQMVLRDPHVFVDLFGVSCPDVTDNPIGTIAPSFNELVDETLNGDDGGDGFLDASFLLVFRPLAVSMEPLPVDFSPATCLAPVETTACAPDPPPEMLTYASESSGSCLEVVAGTTSGYTPNVVEPQASCFRTSLAQLTIDLGPALLPLVDATFAAEWVGAPPTSAVNGLLSGFLSEIVADATLLPPDLPLVGGEPLSSLLPGGLGSCAAGDDRDIHPTAGTGWWIYFNFTAEAVSFLDP